MGAFTAITELNRVASYMLQGVDGLVESKRSLTACYVDDLLSDAFTVHRGRCDKLMLNVKC